MPLEFPELKRPLGGVSVCANKVSLSVHTELRGIVSAKRTEDIAESPGGCVRLLREMTDADTAHIHLDYYSTDILTTFKPNCNLSDIITNFEPLLGKTLNIGFESRFKIPKSDLSGVGVVSAMGSMGIDFAGTKATLSGATIRLNDSVFREIKWRLPASAASKNAEYLVEIMGNIGAIPITDTLLSVIIERAMFGLNRFLLPKSDKSKSAN